MFHSFALEIWLSSHEQNVRYELADSGVPAASLRELIGLGLELDRILALPLHYPEVNGTGLLRERIAGLYTGLTAREVLVTVGATEAAALVVEALTGPHDRVALMRPNYQHLWGLALNGEREVVSFSLSTERDWELNTAELERACTPDVKLIAVCNPNNPTGHVLTDAERKAVIDCARRADAWLLSDEVYVGTEHDGAETASLLGEYEKAIVISSVSKAYGLSGLRLGWIAGPPDVVEACWRRHEYATIAASALSMAIGEYALDSAHRSALLARSRSFIAAGHDAIRAWATASDAGVELTPTTAAPFAFVRLPVGVSSIVAAQLLVDRVGVLVAPGAHLGGFDDHIRITAARDLEELLPALGLIKSALSSL